MAEDIREIEVGRISPNRRIVYSAESIEEIEQSMRDGQQEPILIRFEYDSFRIVDGEKRWRACKRLKMTTIRAVILS
ncbi:MAG: ParB N-terminal domain-containing protein [Deltaproteobacteria bacterium]|jgi:ParB family chromosome partitioning protein|nr:ParB N-terminal domain-containing protein [Deltaproteobacteria bacterium]